jgi:hypothetical protein
MGNPKRTDAVAGKLQKRVDAWSQSSGFVFGQHVYISLHAPSAAGSLEQHQAAEEQGLVLEYVILTMGHELAIPLRIREELAAKLREAAGNCWPVEET